MNVELHHPFVGAYWSSRQEAREACAARVVRFLASVSTFPECDSWFLKGRGRKAALRRPLDVSVDSVADCLKTNNRDSDGTAIDDLGFGLGIWNGAVESPVSLSVTCGAYSRFTGNSAVLSLPPQSEPRDQRALGELEFLLKAAIAAWDPDHAVVSSTEWLARSGEGMPWQVGGWLVFERGNALRSDLFRRS